MKRTKLKKFMIGIIKRKQHKNSARHKEETSLKDTHARIKLCLKVERAQCTMRLAFAICVVDSKIDKGE